MKRELSLIVALMLFASVSCVFAEELNNESPKAIQKIEKQLQKQKQKELEIQKKLEFQKQKQKRLEEIKAKENELKEMKKSFKEGEIKPVDTVQNETDEIKQEALKNETIEQTKETKNIDEKKVQEDTKKEELTPKKEDNNLKAEDKGTLDEVSQKNNDSEENNEEKLGEPAVYRQNLTFADIDKNAVSINEFLQFSDSQNEDFSVYYYKTTTKLEAFKKAISKKEKEIKDVENSNLSSKTKLEKIKKLEKDHDYLMKERDSFYNKSLEKFSSLLTKKQKTKWELLQEMGYRFLPEMQ